MTVGPPVQHAQCMWQPRRFAGLLHRPSDVVRHPDTDVLQYVRAVSIDGPDHHIEHDSLAYCTVGNFHS